jgi:outer membrane protein OmpA-like peptidoglycan-associated protein
MRWRPWVPLVVTLLLVTQGCAAIGGLLPRKPSTGPSTEPSTERPTTTAGSATPATPTPTPRTTTAATPASTPAAVTAAAPVAVARRPELTTAVAARRSALLADGGRLGPDEVGYYMDVQEARLRQLVPSGFLVARRDSALVVTIPGRQTFDVSSARLLPTGLPALAELAKVLVEYRLTIIVLSGFTDSSGDAASNLSLSQARAIAIARQLLAEGVGAKRVVAVGHGDADPVADNATAEGREQNRRVELRIEPLWP